MPPECPHRGRLVNLHVVHEPLDGLDNDEIQDGLRHGLPAEQLQVN